jgi:phosphoglycerol transferase MdoB-like AlkP superfamily enzyme
VSRIAAGSARSMDNDTSKKILAELRKEIPALVLAGLLLVFSLLIAAGSLKFALGLPPMIGVPGTGKYALDTSRQMIFELTWVTLIVAFVVHRFEDKIPRPVRLVLDLLPIVWMFFFVWSLVHNVSELIPARKHPPFNGNAIASAAVAAFAASLVPRRWRGIGVGVLGVVISLIGLADVLHMRVFGNVMPVGSHGTLTQLWDVRSSIASLLESRDRWMLLYTLSAVILIVLWRPKRSGLHRGIEVVAYVIPAFALSYTIGPIRADVLEFLDSKWAKEVLNREDQVWNAGFFEAHVREISLNIKNSIGKKKPTKDELAEVRKFYEKDHAEHLTTSRPSFGQYKGKNVLVIQLEALEEWLVDATVNGQPVMPFLSQLKKKADFYPNVFDIAAMSHTADCEYLVLNSNHPLADAPVAFRAEDNHFVTLATTLRDNGYSTVSMHGYRRGMWNRAVLHPRYGFTHSFFAEEWGDEPKIGWGLDDHVLFKNLVPEVKTEKQPWLAYAITLSSHHPYDAIPWNKRRLKVGALQGSMLGEYLHSASFVDDALSQLFKDLQAQNVLKDTMVVMYGDHAALMHTSPRERAALASQTNLNKAVADHVGTGSLNRIPLLVLLPGQETGEIVPAYGAQIDVAPTILHYVGIDPPRSFIGHALLPGDIGGMVVRWDGSFVSPPLMFDAGLNECRDVADYRSLPPDRCREGAEKAREQLNMSWVVTNNDLPHMLVETAEPAKPIPPKKSDINLGAACKEESDCKAPDGFDARCFGGVCMTDPHGACAAEGSSAPCSLGSECYKFSPDLDVCAADCDVYACAGECSDGRLCKAKPGPVDTGGP